MIEKLLGSGYMRKIEEWIRYSGTKVTVSGFANYSFAIALAAGVVLGIFVKGLFAPVALAGFCFTFILMHGFLMLAVENRTRFVENILPDALDLMAANSRAGYIPSRALLLSARKEFGPLSVAIKNVGKELATGENLEDSLNKINSQIRSELLERTVKLINEGITLGGQFAKLLDENAKDIRSIQQIKGEMKANIMMYAIFITFAGAIGAPLLYALSGFLVGTINQLGSSISVPETTDMKVPFMKMGQMGVSSDFLLIFSLVAIIITTVGGSIIVGMINSGREKEGVKYIPIFLILGLVVFFIGQSVIASLFGSFINP
jgi:Flp pilus assembly protein TadB